MSNKLILSIFIPASSDSDVTTIINVESVPDKGLPVATQGYAVVVTEGSTTHVRAFDSLPNAINYAYEYASLSMDDRS